MNYSKLIDIKKQFKELIQVRQIKKIKFDTLMDGIEKNKGKMQSNELRKEALLQIQVNDAFSNFRAILFSYIVKCS